MNEEFYKFRGRLAEAELEEKKAEISIRGLVASLRNLLDPIAAPEDLSGEQISDQALRLGSLLLDYLEKRAEIALIKKTLGR
jgi:hypothetical protein